LLNFFFILKKYRIGEKKTSQIAQNKYTKAEITRLKNLLRTHRDHIITKKYNALKQPPYNMEITEVIEMVDYAIKLLIRGL